MPSFGVHLGPARTTVEEMRSVWARVEELPFDWISVWDHFWAAVGGDTNCFEGVAVHTALAMSTSRVRAGCLVYCAGYRHPAVLANSMAAIDQFSGGRCEMGLGSGWYEEEYEAHGFDYPDTRTRLDLLDEYALVVKGLLTGEPFDHEGRFFTLRGAVCDPAPIQSPLPLWIGGGGEKRTLRIVARHGDGWNVPFVTPDMYSHKNAVLDEHCADVDRDPAEVKRSVNVGVAADEASLQRQFGAIVERVRPGILMGSTAAMVDGIGRYVEAGADQINVALRAPYELGALEAIAEAIAQLD